MKTSIKSSLKTLVIVGALLGSSSLLAADGAALYKKCTACHGAKAEKKALGKSQVIAGWDSPKIQNALKGYKDGSYGGPMKGLMKGQVASLDDAGIEAVSNYISGLK
jgi:cytochrome c553